MEYALLMGGVFKEIRKYATKPPDIPHKQFTWHDVVRESGPVPFTGIENGNWVIRKVNPATLPQPAPTKISHLQFRRELKARSKLVTFKNWLATASEDVQMYFEYADQIRSNSPEFQEMRMALGLTEDQVDQFFVSAIQR